MSGSAKPTPKPAVSEQSLRLQARAMLGESLGFRDCPPAVLDAMIAFGHLRHLVRGEHLLRRGDPPQGVWMLLSGLLEGYVTHRDGQRHLTGLLAPGGFMAMMRVVDGGPATHDVSAREASTLIAFPIGPLRELRQREPSLVMAFERQIVLRATQMIERLGFDPAVPLEVRAAAMLNTLARLYGRPAGSSIELTVRLSQSDLADWIGMSRQRVNFVLKQLEAEGLIQLHYSTLTITDPARLRERAQR